MTRRNYFPVVVASVWQYRDRRACERILLTFHRVTIKQKVTSQAKNFLSEFLVRVQRLDRKLWIIDLIN